MTEGLPDKRFLVSCNLPPSKYDYITTGSVYYPGESPGKDIYLPAYLLSEQKALQSIQELGTGKVVIDLREIPNYLTLKQNDYAPQDGFKAAREEKRYMLCEMTDRGIWTVDTLSYAFPHTKSLVFAELYVQFHDSTIILDAGQIFRFFNRDEKGKFCRKARRRDKNENFAERPHD